MPLQITSPAFAHGEEIPREHTCDGDDTSPPLRLKDVPSQAKSLALVVDDPDAPDPAAPKRTYVHWVLYDIPPTATELPSAPGDAAQVPKGTREGTNDWHRTGYGGPCPPIGRHRYFFKLYALDTMLGDRAALTKAQLEEAMRGHVIEEAVLMGTYSH